MGLEEDELGRAEADGKAGVSCEGSQSHAKQHWRTEVATAAMEGPGGQDRGYWVA